MTETTQPSNNTGEISVDALLELVFAKNASDLHLAENLPPIIRVDGQLMPVPGYPTLSAEKLEEVTATLLGAERHKLFLANKEIDYSFSFKDKARFRINSYHERGQLATAIRLLPMNPPSLEELSMPPIVSTFAELPQGFILITGPTGQGKSTTLAALVRKINETRNVHILTIEDPIEYIFAPEKALISQREMYQDTNSWDIALRSALREDPNVVLVGEMRDYETIAAAITIAETGHLVFATLHTNSAAQAIDRIIDVFPEEQQRQIRVQLAGILEGVVSQRLLPKVSGGRIAAVEVMLANPAVRNLIREGKTHQLDNVIATSIDTGMISLEQALAKLVKEQQITQETAFSATNRPEELTRLVRK